MPYGQGFLKQGAGGDFDYIAETLPDANFSLRGIVHFRSSDDTAWEIGSTPIAAVPAVPAVFTHSTLSSGIRSGYNFLNPSNRDFIPTATTVGYIYFNTNSNRFRKLDAGELRAFQGTDSNELATNTVVNGRTFAGSFQNQQAALNAGANALDQWFYHISLNQLHYWDDVDNTFRQVGGVGALNFPNYFGSNFIWLQSVNSPSDLDDYFDNNQGTTARRYYWYNTVTSEFNVSTWLAPNSWENVTIDWILDDPNAIFLGINGLEGTEEIDLPAEVETYLDTEDNYDSTKTYIFHNNANATPIDGTVARFTNSQSSSYQGVHSADTRPDATTLSVHDWVYDTTGGQLAFVVFDAIASPPANKWVFAGDNTELDSFFPSVGYSWAGRNTDGPYGNDHTLTEAELLQAIADGTYTYNSTSPLVYFDTDDNQLKYITAYTAPDYGRIHEVDSFTPTVPEIPAYDMPIWEEVLESGAFNYHRLALPDASFDIQDKVHFRASDDTAWKILSQTVAAVPAVPASLTHEILSSIRTGYSYQHPSGRDPATTSSSVAIVYYNTMTNRFRKLDAGGVIPIDRAVNDTIGVGTTINGKTYFGVFAGTFAAITGNADVVDAFYYETDSDSIKYWDDPDSVFRQLGGTNALTFQEFFGTNRRWLGPTHGETGSENVMTLSTLGDYFVANPPDSSLEYYYYNSNGTLYRGDYQLANNWEDVDIDWVLDSDSALFLGDNGLAGTENLDEPDDVESYLDMAGNYDATKTYFFHNQINATIPTGTSPRFTSSQSSSFQGEGTSAERPNADGLDVHDWWYNTTTRQLQYVATSGGNKIWLIATSNVLLDIFFPSVGYTWAGRTGDGPYEQDYEYTIAEIYRAIADGSISYNSGSPLVYFDTNNNQLRYVSSYTAPNYGTVDEVTAFTRSVAEVPSYERPTWSEVLEAGSTGVSTEAEIRTLLGFTVAEQSDTLIDAVLAAGILTFTQEDGGTIPITLPSGADGLVTDATYDAATNVLTLTRSGTLTPLTVDLSDLVDEFADEQAIEYIPPGSLSGVNALTGVADGITAYEDGQGVAFVAETSNSGAMTLRLNSLPFRSIRDINGSILTQNAISIGKLVIAFYQSSSQTWRSNIYVEQNISGKANDDLGNLDQALSVNEQAAIQQKLDVPNTQFAGPSNAGLMPSNLYNKLAGIETGATADQTASEIRTLLGFTAAEQQETIIGATLSGVLLTLTHEDGGTTVITLPSTPGTTDGVVTGVAFNTGTRVLTLTRSGGLDPLTEDLSSLQDERIGEQIHFISDPAFIAGTNSITLTIPGVQTYEDGLEVAFIAENANTGAVSIGVNTLSTTVARRNDDTAFTGGEITVGKLVIAFYDDTVDRWRTNVRPPFEIPDGSITRAKIANSAIDGNKIDAGVIIAAHLAPDAVTPSKIETNAIETRHYSNASITQEKLAAGVGGGTNTTTGAAFPASPSLGHIHIFDVAATGLTNTVNNTASQFVTSADIGDTFKFTTVGSNDRWVLEVDGSARVDDDSLTTAKYRDGSVTEDKLAFGIGTGLEILPMPRSESITLQNVVMSSTVNSAEISSAATNPITVEFGAGVANILSVVGGESIITVLRAGIYDVDWVGDMDVTVARAIPRLSVYRSGDTIGTDEPLTRIDATYFRATGTGEHFTASGHLIISEDNTTIKFVVERIPSLTGNSTPIYTINAGSKVFFSRGAAGGLSEHEVLDFVTEHIRHTIRRRNIVGAGTLQRGDVRFDATTITLNVHNDLDDEWLGDLPVGAEIRIHGLTSGARSSYTLDSVTESGDDATLTVTRDTHSGIFTNQETVVITFDQEHDPQSSWSETDENRPAYIKDKPGRTFYWGHNQTERVGQIAAAFELGAGNRRFRFDSTQREESHGGTGNIVSFVASGDVNADADVVRTGETFEDNQFFTVNGTIDIQFQAHTRVDDDDDFIVRLVKVQTGTDDILLQESTSRATAEDEIVTDEDVPAASAIGNTAHLEYKSLSSNGTEQFSIQMLRFDDTEESGVQGFMMSEEI